MERHQPPRQLIRPAELRPTAQQAPALIGGSGADGFEDFRLLPRLARSSKRCSTVKNDGTNSTARQVEAMMPLSTLRPSEISALAPAPVASTNGRTPMPNANEVIRIGRNRETRGFDRGFEDRQAADHPAFARHLDDQNAVLGR